MSFAAKIHGEKSNMLWLVQGDFNSRKAWWFVFVKPFKLGAFQKDLNADSIKLDEYGDIIASGYGEEPDQYDLQYIREKGFKLNESLFN